MNTTKDLVKAAIEPVKTASVNRALDLMTDQIQRTLSELEVAYSWDRNAMAPYPSSLKYTRIEFQALLHKYHFVRRITSSVNGVRNPKDPDFGQRYEQGIAYLMGETKKEAEAAFDAYREKLAKKIGEGASSVTLVTQTLDLWKESTLEVVCFDGQTRFWKTKTIVNCSVYGKLFLQWPTRKVG